MKKLVISLGILSLLFVSCLSGCLDEKSKFIGTWRNQDESISMTFDSNNKVTITGSLVTLTGILDYSVADQKITFSSGDIGKTFNYSFPESNKLIISTDQGFSLILTKE